MSAFVAFDEGPSEKVGDNYSSHYVSWKVLA
jgi:hypothetical protein